MVSTYAPSQTILAPLPGVVPNKAAPKEDKNTVDPQDQTGFSGHLSENLGDQKSPQAKLPLPKTDQAESRKVLKTTSPTDMVGPLVHPLAAKDKESATRLPEGLVLIALPPDALGLEPSEDQAQIPIAVVFAGDDSENAPLLLDRDSLRRLVQVVRETGAEGSDPVNPEGTLRLAMDMLSGAHHLCKNTEKLEKFQVYNPDKVERGYIHLPDQARSAINALLELQQILSGENASLIYGTLPNIAEVDNGVSRALAHDLLRVDRPDATGGVFVEVALPDVEFADEDPEGYEISGLVKPMRLSKSPAQLAAIPRHFLPFTEVPEGDEALYGGWIKDLSQEIAPYFVTQSTAGDGRGISVWEDGDVIRLMQYLPEQIRRDVLDTLSG